MCPPCYSMSLLVCCLSYQVFISSITFYFELHYNSECCLPAGLTKGLCWTISHSVKTHWLASTHSCSRPSCQAIGQRFKHASLCLFIHPVSHPPRCCISARQLRWLSSAWLTELWLQLNLSVGQNKGHVLSFLIIFLPHLSTFHFSF